LKVNGYFGEYVASIFRVEDKDTEETSMKHVESILVKETSGKFRFRDTHVRVKWVSALPSVPAIVELILLHEDGSYCVSTTGGASPGEGSDIRQWRWHNCSWGTTAVKQLTRYGVRVGIMPTMGPRNILWRLIASVPLIEERISVFGRSFFTDAISRMATSTHCG
jgi:hypothetical protein